MRAEIVERTAFAESSVPRMKAGLRAMETCVPTVDTIVWNHVDYGFDADSGRLAAKFDMAEVCRSRVSAARWSRAPRSHGAGG